MKLGQCPKKRREIITPHARFLPIKLVDMNMPDIGRIFANQLRMRLAFVERVMNIEHGLYRRTADLFDNADRIRERVHNVRLVRRKSFNQNLHATAFCVWSSVSQFMNKDITRLLSRHTIPRGPLFWGAEYDDALLFVVI